MLIEWIELDNFECYFTEPRKKPQRLDFDLDRKERNLTFFVARNNSGKTTIIRALKFLFYNEVDEMQIVNNKALSNIKVGERLTIAVRARVRFDYPAGPEWVTLERNYEAKRLEDVGGELRVREIDRKMTLTKRETPTRNRDYFGADATSMVKEQLPPELFPFYFLDGENLKNKLGLGSDPFDKKMLNAIHDSLYFSVFERAEEICLQSIKKVQRELAGLAKQSKDMEQVQEESDNKALELRRYKEQLEVLQKEFNKHQSDYQHFDERYLTLARSESATATEMLKEARREEVALKEDIKRSSTKIRDSLSDGLPFAFMGRATDLALRVIDSLHERNIFPVNITEDLISELIRQKECVCGSCLEEGTKELKQLQAYRARALRQNMDDDLKGIRSILLENSRSNQTVKSKLSDTKDKMADELSFYREKMTALTECQDRIRRAERKIAKGHDADMQQCFLQRKKAFELKEDVSRKISSLELGIIRVTADKKKYDDELKKKVPKGSPAQKLLSNLTSLQRIQEIIERSKKEIQYEIRSRLEHHTKEIYERISTDNSYAIIQKNLLPDIRNMGQRQNQGGGQKKVLTMAYMVGLANVRKEICAELRKHIHLRVTGEQCFFMDSIYSDMDIEYQKSVTEILPSFVKQLLILVAPQNCSEAVQDKLKGHVTDMYRALHHTTKVKGDDPQSVELWGEIVQLVVPLKEGLAYSQLEKVEVA